EYDSTVGNRQGRIWECGRDTKPRWTVQANLFGPMDVQVLPNKRILVAESNISRVTERDVATGNIVWQHQVPNPVVAQRLPNRNTFIASYYQLQEVNPAKVPVWTRNMGPNFLIFDARRLRNGHIVCINSAGQITELDNNRNIIRTVNTNAQGNWC